MNVTEAVEELIEALSQADDRLCCDGRNCGCRGATLHEMAEHNARFAAAAAEQHAAELLSVLEKFLQLGWLRDHPCMDAAGLEAVSAARAILAGAEGKI